jgi:hypothetical protein
LEQWKKDIDGMKCEDHYADRNSRLKLEHHIKHITGLYNIIQSDNFIFLSNVSEKGPV